MPRDIPIGNGNLLVTFDRDYRIRDFFFPHVGEENHIKRHPFLLGLWVDGEFNWLPDGWELRKGYAEDTLATEIEMVSRRLGLELRSSDVVDFRENIYLRRLAIENLSESAREVRVFFCQDFAISGNNVGDTAAFRPEVNGILHYKGERYFLVNLLVDRRPGIDLYAIGEKGHGGLEGTWKDAEDGVLSRNPIAQGAVDSVAAVRLKLAAREARECHYWICAGRSWEEVRSLNEHVVKEKPERLIQRTRDYWKLWLDKEELDYGLLPDKVAWLYRKSLLILRTQIDNNGAIIAANDSDVVYYNRDTYSYLWPRDGALTAYALDLAGYPEITRQFFTLCHDIIEEEGYFLHKYTPSGAPASTWHPWIKDNQRQLPIQEDETALVLWALWQHYSRYRNVEFIKDRYERLIKRAANFMINYRDAKTRLPLPSYDLWEERQGILTFTVSAVYGGLSAAARFAGAFGDSGFAQECADAAREVKAAMEQHLYLEKERRFCRMVDFRNSQAAEKDTTVDASLAGLFLFGAYPADDPKVASTMEQVRDRLWCKTKTGGLARKEGDAYYRSHDDVPGNSWFVTTLWLAQFIIAGAKSRKELAGALDILQWTADRALPSGVLAEQIDPHTSEPLSVSPLTWSHATFVAAVQEYLDKYLSIEKCGSCGRPKYSKRRGRISDSP
jgi:GH15 family glucan-1,4-alpha-glucosidase